MAHAGALKNRYRIPFGTSIRITATMTHPGIIYCEPRHSTHMRWLSCWLLCMSELTNGALRHCADYVRGMTNLPVIVGDLQLPNAARLRLHKNWGVSVPPLGRLPLVPKRSNSGLLYATICEHQDN